MKKAYLALLLLAILFSCQKNNVAENAKAPTLMASSNAHKKDSADRSNFLLAKIKKDIQGKKIQVSNSGSLDSNAFNSKVDCCKGIHDVPVINLIDRQNNATCTGGDYTLTYIVVVEESKCTYPATYSYAFTLAGYSSTSYQLLDEEDLCELGGGCYTAKTFSVTFIIPSSYYSANSSASLVTSLIRSCAPTYSVTKTASFYYAYCLIPAVVSVTSTRPGITGGFVITECSSTCVASNTTCPISVTVNYRLVGSTTWQTVTLSWSGGYIDYGNLPSGTYEYEATANYPQCSSYVKSDTFVI